LLRLFHAQNVCTHGNYLENSRKTRITSMAGTGLSGLVAQAYEAACDATGMASFVESAADYFGAQQSAITIAPLKLPENFLPVTHGVSAEEIRALFEQRERPGTPFANLVSLPPGQTIELNGYERPELVGHQLTRRRSDISIDAVNVLAGVVVRDENNRCDLLLFRNSAKGEFSPSEHEALRELIGYLQRAIELNKRFVKIFVEPGTALSVIDNASRSVIILGQFGQITYRNSAARDLLAKDDGICLQDERFTIHDAEARAEVDAFLEAARNSEGSDLDAKRLMRVVPRRSGQTPFKLVMYKLPFDRQQAALDETQSLAVALVYDPSTMNQLNENLLRKFYGLSGAEVALAQALFDGHALPEASAELGISVNTARTQLRSIFKKVDVHSQAALVQEFAKSFIHA
jgi:DNA-binding CsgD family transcriptional regulator/PAS domain-containing protein